jgi:hypothetical protein
MARLLTAFAIGMFATIGHAQDISDPRNVRNDPKKPTVIEFNLGVPSNITVGADPKLLQQIKELNQAIKELEKQTANLPPELQRTLQEHMPILIPRGWYEKQQKELQDQATIVKSLQDTITVLKGDKFAQLQGKYHWAGKGCAIEVVDKAKGELRLHFPKDFPDFGEVVLDATIRLELGRVDIYRDGKIVKTAWLNLNPHGTHTLIFDDKQWWTYGAEK